MVFTKDVTITLSAISRNRYLFLEKLGEGDALRNRLREVMQRQANLTAKYIVNKKLKGQLLKRRTGTLAESIEGRLTRGSASSGNIPGFQVGVFRGPALAYARIQEQGGIVRPRRARALAFPPQGSPAASAEGVDLYGGPRNYPGRLVFLPFKSPKVVGGLYDATALSSTRSLANLTPVYLLMREVFIKPKHYIAEGTRARLPLIQRALTKGIGDMFRELR